VDGSGNVTGMGVGTTNIIYSLGPSCDSRPFAVRVDLTPFPITPSGSNICTGDTVRLTETTLGGTWSSSASSVASIDATGLVTGLSAGTSIMGYTTARGCGTSTYVTVNAGPLPIVGSNLVCVGTTTALGDATPGGIWASSNPAVGSVDAFGNVFGITPGNTLVSYTVAGYICPAVQRMAVNAPPAPITGPANVCQGSTATLADVTTGGLWTSSSTGTVTVDSLSGVVTGVPTGATIQIPVTITYSTGPIGTGCDANYVVNANPVPTPVSGPTSLCTGQTITLFDATAGGTWSSASSGVASVAGFRPSASVTGLTAGTADISYTNSFSCAAVANITVNATPTPISGSSNVCLGGTSLLTTTPTGGTWLSLNPGVATVGLTTGVVSGVSLGSVAIRYSTAAGCSAFKTVFVQPLPVVYSVTGGGNHCPSDAGVHIGLNNSSIGVNYMVYRSGTAVGAFAGTGTVLDFGLFTVGGTYTVVATTMSTGCTANMSGSAFINVLTPVTPSVHLNVSPNDTVCAGTATAFTPTVTNGGFTPAYVWKVNGTPVAVTTNYSFVPNDRDLVTVEMTSSAQCPIPATVTASMVMTVLPFGQPNVTILAVPSDSVCRGDAVVLHASVDFGGTAPVYAWARNTYTVPGLNSPSYTFVPNNGDSVWCTVTSNYQCRLSNKDTSNTVHIKVVDPVTPVVTISGNPLVGRGQNDTLTASVAGAVAPTYQWYINGLPVAGATNALFIHKNYSYPKEDSVSVQVTNHGTCEVTGHQWLFIQSTTVGVNNLTTEGSLTVVPNPNKGEFTIKGSLGVVNDEDVSIELTDMIGQVVYKTKVTAKGGKLDEHVSLGKNLANGMYMLTVRSESESQIFHIVVEQ